MRVAKYFQSCFLVEKRDGGRLAIDIGATPGRDSYDLDLFGSLDAVLFTNRHSDHVDPALIDDLVSRGVTLFGNKEVCDLLEEAPVVEVRSGEEVEVADFEVLPADLPHCMMVDGELRPVRWTPWLLRRWWGWCSRALSGVSFSCGR
jgi:L-ascorbate metabolism protein UlaG (beta-lactamase superfamily)